MPKRAKKRVSVPVEAEVEENEFGHVLITLHARTTQGYRVLGRLYMVGLEPRHPFREIGARTRHTWYDRYGNTRTRKITIRFGSMMGDTV